MDNKNTSIVLPLATDIAKILIIRRDNIGDLLCTTPAIAALRRSYPRAHIAALVNSYNAPVLANNPDIDKVYAYTKAKHSDGLALTAWWHEWRVYRHLRRERFDLIIHANPSFHKRTAKLVRYLRGKYSLGVSDNPHDKTFNIAVTPEDISGTHHVERVYSLLRPLGIVEPPGPLVLRSTAAVDSKPLANRKNPVIAIHISSRKPCNRWPLAKFVKLIEALPPDWKVEVFWAPGSADDRKHPGDDEHAQKLRELCGEKVRLVTTTSLAELIAGLAHADCVVCADGGALHIAAALGKTLVALFGCTDAASWGPWQVAHRLHLGHGDAANIDADEIIQSVFELMDPSRERGISTTVPSHNF